MTIDFATFQVAALALLSAQNGFEQEIDATDYSGRPPCPVVEITSPEPISGLTFVSVPSASQPESTSDFLIGAHGDAGLSVFSLKNRHVRKHAIHADVVSSYGINLLAFRNTADGSELQRMTVNQSGGLQTLNVTSPADVSATTLIRNAYALLGPVRMTDTGIKTEFGFFSFPERPTAVAATTLQIHEMHSAGAIAVGFENRRISIFPMEFLDGECRA